MPQEDAYLTAEPHAPALYTFTIPTMHIQHINVIRITKILVFRAVAITKGNIVVHYKYI